MNSKIIRTEIPWGGLENELPINPDLPLKGALARIREGYKKIKHENGMFVNIEEVFDSTDHLPWYATTEIPTDKMPYYNFSIWTGGVSDTNEYGEYIVRKGVYRPAEIEILPDQIVEFIQDNYGDCFRYDGSNSGKGFEKRIRDYKSEHEASMLKSGSIILPVLDFCNFSKKFERLNYKRLLSRKEPKKR